jgi:hypothetical protein
MNKEFYIKLGDLLYAIANVDAMISLKEKEEFQKLIREDLANTEKGIDQYGTNLAYYTEMEFDYLQGQIIETDTALQSFMQFIDVNKTMFDGKKKNLCLTLVRKIADAYYYTNRKEKKLINTLYKKLFAIRPPEMSVLATDVHS